MPVCETCILTDPDGDARSLAELDAQLLACDSCPLVHGPEASPVVARLVARVRAAARQIRKLENHGNLAESRHAELAQEIARTEERMAKLERMQQASTDALEAELRAQIATVERQRRAIYTLSAPILEIDDGALAVPVIGSIDGERAEFVERDLLAAVERHRARWVVLDLTGAEGVDTRTAEMIVRLCGALRLLGARVLLCGVAPAVAQTVVGLGVELPAATAHNLKAALRRISARRQEVRP